MKFRKKPIVIDAGECSIHGCPEFNKSECELPKVKSKPIDVEKMCKLAKSIRDEGKIESPDKLEHSFTDFCDVLDNRELIIEIINYLNKERAENV